jgi:hypothetical protein
MAETTSEEHVHVGDIWRENDMRFARFVKVLAISKDGSEAKIQTYDRDRKVFAPRSRPTWAKVSRFGKGYVRP